MRKRTLKQLLLLAPVFLLLSCYRSSELPKAFILNGKLPKHFVDKNATKITKPFAGYYESVNLTQFDYYENAPTFSYVTVGRKINDEMRYGIYDIATNDTILAPEYSAIELFTQDYFDIRTYKNVTLVYAELVRDTGARALYSINERKYIANFEFYFVLDFTTEISDGGAGNIDVLKTVYGTVDKVQRFNITFDKNGNVERELLPEDSGNYIKTDRLLFNETLPKLKDFRYEEDNGKLTGYKKGKKIFDVAIPTNVNSIFAYDKYLFTQIATMLPDDSRNYTYADGGNKYLLETSRVDLTTGAVRNYRNFDFSFGNNFATPYVDKDENPAYGVINARKIQSKVLLDNALVLFDANLKALVNLSQKDFSTTYYAISENRYLTSTNLVVDENYDKVLDLRNYNNVTKVPNADFLSVRHEGNYGLIDFEGKIIADFKYRDPFVYYNVYAFNFNNINGQYELFTFYGETFSRHFTDELTVNMNEGYYTLTDNWGESKIKPYSDYFTIVTISEDETLQNTFNITDIKTNEKIGTVFTVYNNVTTTTRYVYARTYSE